MDEVRGAILATGTAFPKFYAKVSELAEKLEKNIAKKQEELSELRLLLQEGDGAINKTLGAGIQLELWGPEGPIQEEEEVLTEA